MDIDKTKREQRCHGCALFYNPPRYVLGSGKCNACRFLTWTSKRERADMLQKKCARCHRTIPVGNKCPYCKPDYTPATGIKKKYHTSRWTKLAKLIMARYNGLDQYQLVYEHRIMQAETVHHIIPTKDDESKFYDEDNLIPLSEYTHRQIVHKAYNSSDDEKEAMITKLQKIVKKVEV